MVVVVILEHICPDERENISFLLAVDFCHAPQSVLEKDLALANMLAICFTLDTSHFKTSPLNDDAPANIWVMSVTLDTSHLERSPLDLALGLGLGRGIGVRVRD